MFLTGKAERPCVARSLNENTTKTLNQFETQGHHKALQQKHRTGFHKVIMRLLNRNTEPAFGKVITGQLPKGKPEAGFARQARQTTVSQRKKKTRWYGKVHTAKRLNGKNNNTETKQTAQNLLTGNRLNKNAEPACTASHPHWKISQWKNINSNQKQNQLTGNLNGNTEPDLTKKVLTGKLLNGKNRTRWTRQVLAEERLDEKQQQLGTEPAHGKTSQRKQNQLERQNYQGKSSQRNSKFPTGCHV